MYLIPHYTKESSNQTSPAFKSLRDDVVTPESTGFEYLTMRKVSEDVARRKVLAKSETGAM